MRHKRGEDDITVLKHLKVFVGGLPDDPADRQIENHFAKYGHISHCNVCEPKDGDKNKQSYAFVTFKQAADADCAVVDTQHFPGVSRQLAMGFATPRKKDADDIKEKQDAMLCESDPCKVFVGGIGDRDSEEEVGDFFSQWGLVALIYRDKGAWGFVHFATKEGALRILEESNVIFQRRKLEIRKASESKRGMGEDERADLIKRAIARHFHKKSIAKAPPPSSYPPPGGYYPPPPNYYGAPPPGYPAAPPPAGYPPPPQGGYQPPPSYPPSSYPPPSNSYYGASQPPPSGYYGGPPGGHGSAPPPGREGPPPALPAPAPAGGDPYQQGRGQPALPAPAPAGVDPYQQGRGDPYATHYSRDRDPYASYDRDRESDRRRPEDGGSRDPYAHLSGNSGGYYGSSHPPPGGAPPPAQGAYAAYATDPHYDSRYRPY